MATYFYINDGDGPVEERLGDEGVVSQFFLLQGKLKPILNEGQEIFLINEIIISRYISARLDIE